jgi:hypothetical protein
MTWWLERGDLQLLANHNVVHMRTRFEDHEVFEGRTGGGGRGGEGGGEGGGGEALHASPDRYRLRHLVPHPHAPHSIPAPTPPRSTSTTSATCCGCGCRRSTRAPCRSTSRRCGAASSRARAVASVLCAAPRVATFLSRRSAASCRSDEAAYLRHDSVASGVMRDQTHTKAPQQRSQPCPIDSRGLNSTQGPAPTGATLVRGTCAAPIGRSGSTIPTHYFNEAPPVLRVSAYTQQVPARVCSLCTWFVRSAWRARLGAIQAA